jgi:hypothetical protein
MTLTSKAETSDLAHLQSPCHFMGLPKAEKEDAYYFAQL